MTFPLGDPVNRKPEPEVWFPIKGRPHWFRHLLTGEEKYVDPHAGKPKLPPGVITPSAPIEPDILCAREE